MSLSPYIWHGEVRNYEVDAQGIVNNAHYFHFLDNVRVEHMRQIGLDWFAMHEKGWDLVLVHSDMSFKHPLRGYDTFYITSEATMQGRLKVMFEQSIFRSHDKKLIVHSKNTVVCVDAATGRACMPEQIKSYFTA